MVVPEKPEGGVARAPPASRMALSMSDPRRRALSMGLPLDAAVCRRVPGRRWGLLAELTTAQRRSSRGGFPSPGTAFRRREVAGRPPRFVEGDRGVHEARRDDGAAL